MRKQRRWGWWWWWFGVVNGLIALSGVAVVLSPPMERAAGAGSYVPLETPQRLLDTRPGATTADSQFAGIGIQAAGSTLSLHVAGRVGLPADADAVVLNVTAVEPIDVGYLTVFPCGTGQPNASNVNYTPATNVANAAIAKIGGNGDVCVYTFAATHLAVDVAGYLPAGSYVPLETPQRLLDTRPGATTADGQFAGGGIQAAGSTLTLHVAGRVGLPAGVGVVVLNVTAVDPTDVGYLTAFPCGAGQPNASNLNYYDGTDIANTVVARTGGSSGNVCIYTFAATHLVVDVAGYLPADTYLALEAPQRLLDSRPGGTTADGQFAGIGPQAAGSTLRLRVAGRVDVPANAGAVVLNVTAVDPTHIGFLTVFPTGANQPNASNLNYHVRRNIANTVVAKIGEGGNVCIYTFAATHLVVDVAGYLPGPAPATGGPDCPQQPRAFPSAEGWGTETPGGRGGEVCQVTNLDDSGAGSFRDCVTRTGPRIVIFRVSGTITTSTRIDVTSPNLTVLGQTAPVGGITLRANHPKDILRVQADDVVIRYLRFRHGTPSEISESADNLLVGTSDGPVYRVVIDHSSFSWAVDGNLETYYEAREVTFSWNLITEPLGNNQHPEGEHAKNMHLSGDGAGRFTIHHNLLANGNDRNPQPTGLDDYDIRNNVVYNWGKKATYVSSSNGPPTGNIARNYWKPGPNSSWADEVAHYEGDTCDDCHRTFVEGNIGPNRPTNALPESYIVREQDRGELVPTPFTVPPVTTTSAEQAYVDVLANAGASFPLRDPIDERAVTQTQTDTGAFIDHESEVGGYPTLPIGTAPLDTDGDGMPDSFESAHGTDPAVADATGDRDGDGYSNIEDWANSLVGEDTPAPGRSDVDRATTQHLAVETAVDTVKGVPYLR